MFLSADSEDNTIAVQDRSAQILGQEMHNSLKMQIIMYQIGHLSFNVHIVWILFDKRLNVYTKKKSEIFRKDA